MHLSQTATCHFSILLIAIESHATLHAVTALCMSRKANGWLTASRLQKLLVQLLNTLSGCSSVIPSLILCSAISVHTNSSTIKSYSTEDNSRNTRGAAHILSSIAHHQ